MPFFRFRLVSRDAARDAIKELSQLSAITMPSSPSFDHLNGYRSVRYVRMSNIENGTCMHSFVNNF